MNIESSNINRMAETKSTKTIASSNTEPSVTFSDELKELEELEANTVDEKTETANVSTKNNDKIAETSKEDIVKVDIRENGVNNAIANLNSIVKEFNQSEDKFSALVKDENTFADNNNVINNDINIQENNDLLPQMNPNMNFSGNGQPFSSFMNNQNQTAAAEGQLSMSSKDLAEEAAILSTMAENIALVNKNEALKSSDKTVIRNDGIKNIDTKTGVKTETIVKFDSVIMSQADVEVFVDIVENKPLDVNTLTSEAVQKSVKISKTLADMLVKAKETSQPLRIDFDNNISVIIRISRDGKISADFLPSSQVAEAYLKENLPLLKQRFDEKNIEYDSLNQKERRDSQREQNRKKGRSDE